METSSIVNLAVIQLCILALFIFFAKWIFRVDEIADSLLEIKEALKRKQ